jgi:sugar phosphate isomerase/epimerase
VTVRARLGINNCFAVKRWPLPDEWCSIVRNDLGLDLVELSLDVLEGLRDPAGIERTIDATRLALSRHDLSVEATFTGLSAYSLNLLMHPDAEERNVAQTWFENVVDVTVALGARATGGHVGAMSVPDWSDPKTRADRWAALKEHLAALAAYARRAGLDYLMVENLVAVREPSSFAHIDDLLTDGDDENVPIKLCLDVGHQVVPGTAGAERDPYAWLERFGPRLVEVQLQQSDAAADHHWSFTPEHNAAGRIDARRVLDTLVASGAKDVLLILEIIPGWEDPDERVVSELQASVELWRNAIEEREIDA